MLLPFPIWFHFFPFSHLIYWFCLYLNRIFVLLFFFWVGSTMSSLGFKTLVYHGEVPLGELDFIPIKDQNFQFPNNEIRIHHLSQVRSRSNPLSVLQIISESGVVCKLEPCSTQNPNFQSELIRLHSTCFYDKRVLIRLHSTSIFYICELRFSFLSLSFGR